MREGDTKNGRPIACSHHWRPEQAEEMVPTSNEGTGQKLVRESVRDRTLEQIRVW